MSINYPATKAFLFFAYQYYIRSFMVKGQENKILDYIKSYPPQKSTLYYLFNQDIALEYSSLSRCVSMTEDGMEKFLGEVFL